MFLVLTSRKFLEALGSGIGTGLVICHSFSVSNNVVIFEEKFDSESVCTVPFVMMMPLNVNLLIKDSIKHGISVQS